MITAAVFVVFLVALAILFGFFAVRHRRSRGALAFISLAAVCAAFGVNSLRAVPVIDARFGEALQRGAPDRRCNSMLTNAYALVDPATGSEPLSTDGQALVRCPVQTVINDGSTSPDTPVPEERCWSGGTPPVAAQGVANCYKLAFLEFSRNGGLIQRHQLELVQRSIEDWRRSRPGAPVYMIAYVHGWRHDASVGDSDVRRLRVMTSYASSNVRERCRVAGRYCNALVLGLYIGWPGAIGLHDGPSAVWAPLNSLTFASRKRVSDALGPPVMATLRGLADAVWATAPDSRVLVLGHSLGGNLLLSGALPLVHSGLQRAAATYDQRGAAAVVSERLGLPADLTVLLNPAAEARKWNNLRISAAQWFVEAGQPCPQGVCRQWPATMPPRLMFATSRCEYFRPEVANLAGKASAAERDRYGFEDDGKYPCDGVVSGAFRTSQTWLEWQRSFDLVKGVGQLSTQASPEEAYEAARQNSHFVETNWQRGLDWRQKLTSYANARDAGTARCFVEPSWLFCARTRSDDSTLCGDDVHRRSVWGRWDAGEGKPTERTLARFAERGAPGQSNVQFGYPGQRGTRATPVQGSDPLWGVEANVTAVENHGAIASSPLVCLWTKLLFDNAARAGSRDAPDRCRAANSIDYAIQTGRAVRGQTGALCDLNSPRAGKDHGSPEASTRSRKQG